MSTSAPLSRGRRITVWVLLVVATIIAVVSILTVYVNRQLLDNKSWTNASAKVIADPEVQNALSIYLTNQLYQNVDVTTAIEDRLPTNLKPLASPLAGLIKERTPQIVSEVLARPRVQSLFVNVSQIAHQKLVNVLENKTGYGISTGNGVVTLNLSQLLTEVGNEVGVPQAALSRLPADAGQITLLKSDQLSAAQKGVNAIRILSVWLLVLVFVLYAIAIAISPGSRRVVLRRVGWSLILTGVLVLIAQKYTGNYVINALSNPQSEQPVRHIWLIETVILRQVGWAAVLYGVLVLIGCLLAGTTRLARNFRAGLTPSFQRRPEIVWGGAGLLFLLLVLWAPTHALGTWWGILLIGALIALGVYVLQRQTLAEAAAGTTTPIRWRQPRETAPAAAAQPSASASEEIARLKSLLDQGSITSEEFERGKALALSS
jgi:hypothetical protein